MVQTNNIALSEKHKQMFLERVIVDDGCWGWNGTITGTGYGTFGAAAVLAHRFSHFWFNREDPAGQVVRHKCDNPICTNPSHLEAGTPKDNVMDRKERGRSCRGEDSHFAKLTEQDVIDIRRSELGSVALAAKYGVQKHVIFSARSGRSWAHVDEPADPTPRIRKGEQVNTAKLSEDDVRAIRSAKGTQKEIAANFNIDPSTVSLIQRKKRWAHVI